MERYIIPFEHQGKSYYVFIDKDPGQQVYRVGKMLPYTAEQFTREIPFGMVATFVESGAAPASIESAILSTLYRFLRVRGWLSAAQ